MGDVHPEKCWLVAIISDLRRPWSPLWEILNVGQGKGEKSNLVGDSEQNRHVYSTLHWEMGVQFLYRFQDLMYKAAARRADSNLRELRDAGYPNRGRDKHLQGNFEKCRPQQFLKALVLAVEKRITTGHMRNCACDGIFADSMYDDSFRRYFKNFGPSSFRFVPSKQAALGEAAYYAWEFGHVGQGKGEKRDLAGDGNGKNYHDYLTLHKGRGARLLSRLQDFMYKTAGSKAVPRCAGDWRAPLQPSGGKFFRVFLRPASGR